MCISHYMFLLIFVDYNPGQNNFKYWWENKLWQIWKNIHISHKIWDKNLTTCKLIKKKTLLLLIIGKIKQAAILSSYLTNEIQKMNYAQQWKVPKFQQSNLKFQNLFRRQYTNDHRHMWNKISCIENGQILTELSLMHFLFSVLGIFSFSWNKKLL